MRMNRGRKAIIGIIIAGIVIAGSVYSMAAAGDPGSEADPLVTKSYVDSKISEIAGGSSGSSVDEDEIVAKVLSMLSGKTGGAAESYTPVNIKEGKIIIADEGTEIILHVLQKLLRGLLGIVVCRAVELEEFLFRRGELDGSARARSLAGGA